MSGFVDLVCFCCLSDSFQKLCDKERLCVQAVEKKICNIHQKPNKPSLLTFVPEAPDDVGRRRGAAVVVEAVVQFQHVLGGFGAGPRPGSLIRPVQRLQKLTQNLLHVHFIPNT